MSQPAAEQHVHLLSEDHSRLSTDSATTYPDDNTSRPRHLSHDTARNAGSRSHTPNPPSDPPEPDGDSGVALTDMNYNELRPPFNRPTRGISGTPLLYKTEPENGKPAHAKEYDEGYDDEEGPVMISHERSNGHAANHPLGLRQTLSRHSTLMHSHSPQQVAAENNTRKKYMYASFFLAISLVSFCIQTELSAYVQHDLGWDKAYCMMYFTHGSWIVLWPVMLVVQRVQKRKLPWSVFWQRHLESLRDTAIMVEKQTLDVARQHDARPVWYMARYTAFITSALTVAGLSWYIAVSLTTPSDLTAIYNCSAFFAYVFSVPILKEPLRLDKSVAVLIAIGGVLVVAYGDTKTSSEDGSPEGSADTSAGSRFVGNIVIGVGSVLYGLYEVMYKRLACPPEGVSPGRGTSFAVMFGALIGFFTLTVLWIPLPIIHYLGIEKFELPDASTGWLVLAAVLANATFSGSFLVLISLTSPVLSSVAALLTIFIVAIADWLLTGEPLSLAAIIGGAMIIVAFVGLSWSTFREMQEHEAQKLAVDFSESDEDGDLRSDDD